MRKVEAYNLPAPWAPYLINGDEDGLGAAEAIEIDDWLEARRLGACIDVSGDPSFSWHNDGPNPSLGGDILTYTFEVRK